MNVLRVLWQIYAYVRYYRKDINFSNELILLFKRKFWKFRLLVSKLLIKYLDKWYIQKSLVDFCKQQLSEQKHKGDLKTNKILFDLYDENVSNSIKFSIE